jgi:serine/threonine-protein kinase
MGTSVSVGEILAGKYRIERTIGAGGMGVVLAARHIDLDTKVAIKLMQAEALEDPQAGTRFLREARAAAQLKGAHIARVTDYGKLESGEPYSVIEYLEGKDLSEVLKDSQIAIGHAVDYLCQTCEAISEAHAQGIIHRDIKPSNLFLTRTPTGKPFIKVLDFGISKFTLGGDQSLELAKTSTRAVLGSPLYMSPEQMRASRDVDMRSDVWSLGATLYQLLTGEVPFTADTMMELCVKVANDEPPRPRSLRPEIPAPLEAATLRCLRRNPDERFQTVDELAEAIAPFAAAGRTSAAEIVIPARTATNDGTPPSSLDPSGPTRPDLATEAIGPKLSATDPSWGKTQGAARERSRSHVFAIGAAVVIVGAVTALWLKLSSGTPRPEPDKPAVNATPTELRPPVQSVPMPMVVPEVNEPAVPPPPSASTPPAKISAPPAIKRPVDKKPPVKQPGSDDPMANPL